MQLDAFTVVLFGLFIKATLGVLLLIFWLREARAVWFAWGCGAFALAGVSAALFVLRGAIADFLSMGFGTAALISACACAWQIARTFERRRALWTPVLALPIVWLGFCLVPGVIENTAYRVVASSLLSAPLFACAAYEYWRGRSEALPSRWLAITLFGTLSLFFALRIPLVQTLPFPFGALPIQPGWVSAFNLILVFHTVILAVLIISMTKERLELDERTNAQTDSLTGALNRRAFMTRGTRLMLRHRVEQRPLCLVFLDLDHFKALNDRFGHSGGDDVLVKFVEVVHDSIRPTDFLFRIGGEEFCCLLPSTTEMHAEHVAERIRQKFEAATVVVGGTPVEVTVSVGVASTEAHGYDIEALMHQADLAVYAAKRQGRNRVAVAAAALDAGQMDNLVVDLVSEAKSVSA